jgi:hypothetical protein
MATDEEVKERVTVWLNVLAADFSDEGTVKLVQHLDKCLNRNGNYVEKYTYIVSSVYNKTALTLKMSYVHKPSTTETICGS